MTVQRQNLRLDRIGDFIHSLKGKEHGSPPSLTTRDREQVSVLEVSIKPWDFNPRPLTPQFVTLATLPRTGRECMNQVFAVGQVCEKYLANEKNVLWAFMDLEKPYDTTGRYGMWQILRVHIIRGTSINAVNSFMEIVIRVSTNELK